ncbi:hypothetical protein DM01DRAFT_306617 [Hesseltinella vesiculosa]|uniref:Uncharacterized protein n=1 Tax=Hesseltinella vesiculosa TaxID=101127 RepID=A0A1X2GIY7_9FUNG|nr:hypothetical protein DM01DRAFT_306617 [Hesseltinella vesiculosa]
MGLQDNDLIYIDPHFSRCALETKSLKDYTPQVSQMSVEKHLYLSFFFRTWVRTIAAFLESCMCRKWIHQ